MANPLISIIIPIYNSELYLERCLKSVLSQSFSSYEVILVDDGSTDSSLDICNLFAAKDSRIKVLHQENKGVSSARNLGLEAAKGDWIAFVDSDDAVKEGYLTSLWSGVVGTQNCLVIQAFSWADSDANVTKSINLDKRIYHKEEFDYLINHNNISVLGYPFAKLYNREILNRYNIRFNPLVSLSEDMLFMLQYLEICDVVSMSNCNEYLYYFEDSTLSTRVHSYESEYELFSQLRQLILRNDKLWRIPSQSDFYQIVERVLYRAIISNYYTKTYKKKSERIAILRMIYRQHKEDIVHYNSPLIFNRVIKFCFRYRLILPLDIILSLLIRKISIPVRLAYKVK
ncbi:MAG: glycosyltransferase family 2 protein [bacterium]